MDGSLEAAPPTSESWEIPASTVYTKLVDQDLAAHVRGDDVRVSSPSEFIAT